MALKRKTSTWKFVGNLVIGLLFGFSKNCYKKIPTGPVNLYSKNIQTTNAAKCYFGDFFKVGLQWRNFDALIYTE